MSEIAIESGVAGEIESRTTGRVESVLSADWASRGKEEAMESRMGRLGSVVIDEVLSLSSVVGSAD